MEMNLKLRQLDTRTNFSKLAEIIQADEKYFDQFGEVIDTEDGPIVYKDNGAKILAVAHIDTVVAKPKFHGLFYANLSETRKFDFDPVSPCKAIPDKRKTKRSKNKVEPFLKKNDATMIVAASGLDDRLGVFIILELLPQMGVEYDYILTTNEERGMSTATGFQKSIANKFDKKYNWFVEFDRRAEDCVTYRYNTKQLNDALKDADFKIGVGSYTDICDMFEHGVCGINVGVGYHKAHSLDSWCSIDMLYRNLDRFKTFYDRNKDTKFEINTSNWWKRTRTYVTNVPETGHQPYLPVGNTNWHSDFDSDWGKKLEYVWFYCSFCRKTTTNIKKGDIIDCNCGTQYRRSYDDGDIYRYNTVLEKFFKSVVITKRHESYPMRQKAWIPCSICSSYRNPDSMSKIDKKKICSDCTRALYSECGWCERPFFSLGLDEIELCEECNEILYLYGKAY